MVCDHANRIAQLIVASSRALWPRERIPENFDPATCDLGTPNIH